MYSVMASSLVRLSLTAAALCSVSISAHPVSDYLYPSITRRDGNAKDIQPASQVSLSYQSVESSLIEAVVHADLHLPSVLLEGIRDLTSVACTPDSVIITFTSRDTYEASYSMWPHSDLLLVTNHLGNCDVEAERGFYRVSSLAFNNDTLTVTASTDKTTLQQQARNVNIAFDTPVPAKREFSRSINLDWSGDLVNTDGVKIHVDSASFHSTVRISGVIGYNLETHTASTLQLDTSLDLDATLGLHASAAGKFSRNLYTYVWSPISMPGLNIPGILRIGPVLDISVGADFATTGAVEVISNNTVTNTGLVHLDLLNAAQSSVLGFDPKSTATGSILAKGSAQLDPFVEAGVGIGVHVFEDLLDLSSAVKARGALANAFNVNTDETQAGDGAALRPWQEVCEYGYWYTCGLIFDVIGFVTQFYSLDLYHAEVPVYNSSCIHF
ncbi:putative isoamyl alcohol oxidase [Aspergillus clavatus NRRL 1]|uniref:DUF7029 domain-containing protein n=1 Tax=Aspergillus clavatus (strain ATCC 1007 / CBS 513.65 / DSM 816 / NCTC 3887 / NRRL 1 / QM 1276 / 107) TaxID=344612 RepID=A1CGE1_ASPCL|nr:uncharacterized protein ACLA_066570 [Aspergillus clavatus NRRL 1]EAW11021.1 hypothetical protein ACLA_066570 [Aspergillus clavatus NRRL 1]